MAKQRQTVKLAWVFAVLVAGLFGVSQVYLFIHKGTLLGYQLRKESTISTKKSPQDVAMFTAASANGSTVACKKVPQTTAESASKEPVTRSNGIFADRTTPYLISNCVYRVKDGSRSINIVYREYKDNHTASQTFVALKDREKSQEVNGVGSQALFVSSINQLIAVEGPKVVLVTVTPSGKNKPESQAVAKTLAKAALK